LDRMMSHEHDNDSYLQTSAIRRQLSNLLMRLDYTRKKKNFLKKKKY